MYSNATSRRQASAGPGRTFVICGAGLCMVLLAWRLWPASEHKAFVRLPEGRTLTQVLHDGALATPRGWHTNIYCRDRKPTPSLNLTDRARLWLEGIRGQVHGLLGQTLYRVPS